MLATLIIRCPLIRLCRGLCSAQTYSRKGGTSLLHRVAWGHESGVIAKQALGESTRKPLRKSTSHVPFVLLYVSHRVRADSS